MRVGDGVYLGQPAKARTMPVTPKPEARPPEPGSICVGGKVPDFEGVIHRTCYPRRGPGMLIDQYA